MDRPKKLSHTSAMTHTGAGRRDAHPTRAAPMTTAKQNRCTGVCKREGLRHVAHCKWALRVARVARCAWAALLSARSEASCRRAVCWCLRSSWLRWQITACADLGSRSRFVAQPLFPPPACASLPRAALWPSPWLRAMCPRCRAGSAAPLGRVRAFFRFFFSAACAVPPAQRVSAGARLGGERLLWLVCCAGPSRPWPRAV